ncbi:MAG: MgtC/SapB family protein, partial [Candidatus Zixiibacteriota bacterium]
ACAWTSKFQIMWMLPVGLLAICAMAVVGYLAKLKEGHVGWTSEVAAFLTFVTGALCLLADIWLPLALGIVGTFLLSEKSMIEKYVERLDKAEFLAVLKFLIVTLIILPVLPDEEYTQFKLNPRSIWQIVVLVSTIGFAGYFLAKKFGNRVGLWLSGILGGIVSSTAVSITTGRIAQNTPAQSKNALQASILASSMMYLRILVLIWFINQSVALHLWPQLLVLMTVGICLSLGIKSGDKSSKAPAVKAPHNPFEIKPALIFASLFVILTVATIFIKQIYGHTGLVVLAAATGVTDIDPFILSLVNQSVDFQSIVVTSILVAMMSNTVMKGIYFGMLAKQARPAAFWRYGLWAVMHIPIIFIF